MAEGKNSIVIYADWIKKFEALSDDEAGRLIKHFFRYVNDLNPVAPDRITELSFIDIEQSLKRDLIKWEKRAERSRENGKSGGRPSQDKNPEKPKETHQVILEPKKPDSDNVSVTVSGSVIGSVKIDDGEKEKKTPSSPIYSIKEFEKVEIAENDFTLLACRRSGKSVEEVKILFIEFLKDQRAVNKIAWQNEPDAKTHFHNWIAKKKGSSTGRRLVN